MQRRNKFHLTQSLLSDFGRVFTTEDGYEAFLKSLYRQPKPLTEAMANGIEFESCVNSVLDGEFIPKTHKWYKPVMELADYLKGSQKQVTLKRDIVVDGVCFELYGVLDFLRSGIIYDTKFSKHYYLNKYLTSFQHPLYFYLTPEAREFQYLSCDGQFIYKETYHPDEVTPIEVTIKQFMVFLDRSHLIEPYTSLWNLETYYESKRKEEWLKQIKKSPEAIQNHMEKVKRSYTPKNQTNNKER